MVAFLGIDDPLTDPQNRRVGLLDLASGERRWIATGDIDRTWAPFPGAQPPIWDGDGLVVACEDRGDVHVYRVGEGADPQPLIGGERVVTGYDRAGGTMAFTVSTVDRPAELLRDRRRRTGAPAHDGHRAVRRPSTPAARRALRRPVDRRRRGRLLGDHAAGLRPGPALPRPPQRARRPVLPVRRPVLRRGADPGRRGLRRRDGQPPRLVGPRHGLGSGHQRPEPPEGPRARVGFGRRRRRARHPRRGAAALPRGRPRPGRHARRQLRRLHGDVAGRHHATASRPSAASGP